MKKLVLLGLLWSICCHLLVAADLNDHSTWTVSNAFDKQMTVTAVINVNCVDLTNPSNKVAAFVGTECRGVELTSVEVDGTYLAYLTVESNQSSGETISFRVYEENTNQYHTIVTTASFQDGASYGIASSPFVLKTNNAPTNLGLSANTIAENAGASANVGSFTITDDNGQTHSYTLVSGTGDTDNGSFSIAGGTLTAVSNLNYEAKSNYSVRVRGTDGGGCYTEQNFTIEVTNVNEAPASLELSNLEIDENNVVNQVIGSFSTTDPDNGDSHTYALAAGGADNDKFTVTSAGVLKAKQQFDYENKSTYNIAVKTVDAGSLETTENFTITIENVNDNPTQVNITTNTINENTNVGTTVGVLSTEDEDTSDGHTYSFVNVNGNDNASFTIVGNELRNNISFDYETKNLYYIYVLTNDGNGGAHQEQIIININDANDAPTNVALNNLTIDENNGSNALVGIISTTDEDANNTYAYTLVSGSGGTNNDLFRISNDSLFANNSFDYETKINYSVRIQTYDGSNSLAKAFAIVVNDKNDAPLNISLNNLTVEENATNTVVGAFSTYDVDASDNHSYTLVAGTGDADNSKFRIEGNTLITKEAFNYELKDEYNVRIKSTDSGAEETEQAFIVEVQDVNEKPTNINVSVNSFDENLSLGTDILTFTSVDPDDSNTFTYELDGDETVDNELFSVTNNTLKVNAAFNFEAKSNFVVKIKTTDQGGLEYSKLIPLTVNDVNDKPTNVSLDVNTISENLVGTNVVGVLLSEDEDNADTHNYKLVSGQGSTNNNLFTIIGDSLYATISFDFEAKSSYSVRIQTNDVADSVAKVLNIQILDANDAPTGINFSSNLIAENQPIGTEVCNLTALDVDAVDSHSFELVAGDSSELNQYFDVDGDKLITKAIFDYETISDYYVRLKVSDSENMSYTAVFPITIQDVNDAPYDLTISDTLFAENLAVSTPIFTLQGEDHDANETFTYHFQDSDEYDNDDFLIVDNEIVVNGAIDFEEKDRYVINLRVEDAGGLSFVKQFVLQVTDTNDKPTDITIDNASFWEQDANGTLVGELNTIDQDAVDSYIYTLVPEGQNLDYLSFSIENDSLVTNATFNYNLKNNYRVKIRSTDILGEWTENIFNLFVKNSNDAPTLISLMENTINENTTSKTIIGAFETMDPDSGDGHTYSLVAGEGDEDNSLFEIEGSNLVTTNSFDFEAKSSYSVLVQAADNDGGLLQLPFTIEVMDVNDKPTDLYLDNNSFDENLPKGTPIIMLNTEDQDLNDTFIYTFNEDQENDNELFAIEENWLILDHVFDFEEEELYTIRLATTDANGLSLVKQFIVYVNDVNDAPLALDLVGETIGENTTGFVGKLNTTDEDIEDNFIYSLVDEETFPNNAVFAISNDSLFLTQEMSYEGLNTLNVKIASEDFGGEIITNSFQITIQDRNDVPTEINMSNTSITELNEESDIIGLLTTEDEDVSDSFTYSFVYVAGNNNNLFEIDNDLIKTKTVFDFEAKESYRIDVRATDKAGAFTDKMFTINILNQNEKPFVEDLDIVISEKDAIGTQIGQLIYGDVDVDDMLSFHFLQDSEVLSVDDEGVVSLSQSLNYENITSYETLVVISDANGLKDTSTVFVTVNDEVEHELKLPVNKLLSPNGDGRNDYFYIENVSIYESYTLTIFNNAGAILYQVTNYDNTWNGTYNGKSLDTGVYYYMMQNTLNSEEVFKGTFSIIK